MRYRVADVIERIAWRLCDFADVVRSGRLKPQADPNALRRFTGRLTFGDFPVLDKVPDYPAGYPEEATTQNWRSKYDPGDKTDKKMQA